MDEEGVVGGAASACERVQARCEGGMRRHGAASTVARKYGRATTSADVRRRSRVRVLRDKRGECGVGCVLAHARGSAVRRVQAQSAASVRGRQVRVWKAECGRGAVSASTGRECEHRANAGI